MVIIVTMMMMIIITTIIETCKWKRLHGGLGVGIR